MSYNLTDEDLAALTVEQLLELSDANIRMSRRLDAEMARRGLITEENDMIHADDAYSGPGNERPPWAQSGTLPDPDETAGTWIADAGNNRAGYDPEPDVIKRPIPGARVSSGSLDPDSANAKRFVPPGFRLG